MISIICMTCNYLFGHSNECCFHEYLLLKDCLGDYIKYHGRTISAWWYWTHKTTEHPQDNSFSYHMKWHCRGRSQQRDVETNIHTDVSLLNHVARETHICVGKLTTIASDNGFSPGRRQAIIWTNAGILLIGPLGTNYNEILIGIHTFSFKKMHLKMSSAKWRPFCLGLNVLMLM